VDSASSAVVAVVEALVVVVVAPVAAMLRTWTPRPAQSVNSTLGHQFLSARWWVNPTKAVAVAANRGVGAVGSDGCGRVGGVGGDIGRVGGGGADSPRLRLVVTWTDGDDGGDGTARTCGAPLPLSSVTSHHHRSWRPQAAEYLHFESVPSIRSCCAVSG